MATKNIIKYPQLKTGQVEKKLQTHERVRGGINNNVRETGRRALQREE